MRLVARSLLFLGFLVLPTFAYAQATLAGVVRDASGGVLPGVTVEASSTALIEKVRSAVTDGSGQYRITDLAPGAYSVAYTLPGFAKVVREGLTLSAPGPSRSTSTCAWVAWKKPSRSPLRRRSSTCRPHDGKRC